MDERFLVTSEKDLQGSVLETMRWQGWMCYHTFDSRRSAGGFPDLVAVRPPRLMFVEFKSEKGKLSSLQIDWLDELVQAHDEVYVVRPSTQDAFMKVVAYSGNMECHWRNVRGT